MGLIRQQSNRHGQQKWFLRPGRRKQNFEGCEAGCEAGIRGSQPTAGELLNHPEEDGLPDWCRRGAVGGGGCGKRGPH